MKKVYLILVVAMALMLMFSACDQTPTNTPSESQSEAVSEASGDMDFPTENITLHYTWWGNQVRHERTQAIIAMFEDRYPNVKIEPEFLPGAEYQDKLLTLISTKSTPDIFQTEYEYTPMWAKDNVSVNLQPYVDAGIIDLTNCTSLDACRFQGDLYSHNLGLNGPSIMYDINLLEELGIEVDNENPWTWDEFLDVGREVFEKSGVRTSLRITFRMTDWIRCSARNNGQELFFDDSKMGFTDENIVTRCYDVIEKAVNEGFAIPAEYYAGYASVEQEPIVAGDSWNACLTSNMVIGLQAAAGDDRPIGFMMIPDHAGTSETGQYLKPSQVICAGNESTDKEKIVAATYINFMVSDVEANKILLGERGVPCNSEVISGIMDLVDPASQRMFSFISTATKFAPPLVMDECTFVAELQDYSTTLADSVYYKQDTANSAKDKFMSKIAELIADADR